jgi:hypothetical protein
MFAQMYNAASARASAPYKAHSSKSFPVSSCRPKLILTELTAGFSALPLELFGGICDHLGQHDLTQFAQTCRYANDASERRLWKHLNLVDGESDLPAQWWRMGPRPKYYEGLNQRCYRELIDHLEDRPDLATSVDKVTIPAHRFYSKRVANLINLLGPTLKELDFRCCFESRMYRGSGPCWVNLDQLFEQIHPLPRVTKMNIGMSFQWAEGLNGSLTATPNLQELHLAVIEGYPCGLDYDMDAEVEPIYAAYEHTPPTPSLPCLTVLSIEQMSIELESVIIQLLKSSSAPTIKLLLGDPAGYYIERGQIFRNFLSEWTGSGRMKLEIALPYPDMEENTAFFEEAHEAELAAWAAERAAWVAEPWPEVGEYKEEEMEPVTPQGAPEDGWPSDLGLGLW